MGLSVEASPLPVPTAPPVDSSDLAAPLNSPTNLPAQDALESPSSQLALESVVSTDKTDSSPVSVEGDKSKPPCPPEELVKFETDGLLTKQLGIRFGYTNGTSISQKWAEGVTPEQFAEWSADKDPNGLSWWRHGVSKATRYKPFPPTPSP